MNIFTCFSRIAFAVFLILMFTAPFAMAQVVNIPDANLRARIEGTPEQKRWGCHHNGGYANIDAVERSERRYSGLNRFGTRDEFDMVGA